MRKTMTAYYVLRRRKLNARGTHPFGMKRGAPLRMKRGAEMGQVAHIRTKEHEHTVHTVQCIRKNTPQNGQSCGADTLKYYTHVHS